MNVLIRDAIREDAPTIARFNVALAKETETLQLDVNTVLRGVTAALADAGKARYFVAEVGGQIVGCCMITHEWSDWRNGDIWWLQSVYVLPEHRRRGVFRALYRHVRASAQAAGAVALRLYVERANVDAIRTYSTVGMRLTNYQVMEQSLSPSLKQPQ
ncbi:MAG: GNAT family N-acetyltransferase [Phycisphaerales bacterium]|nr:GNAT family N-acetyltransferase [Phycisphaerales bacterium]